MAGGRVLRAPYQGAIGLLTWATDLWPYINGQSLVLGLQISELAAVDMLDVLHYFFEKDHTFSTAEEVDAQSALRLSMYSIFYKKQYKHSYTSSNKGYNYSNASGAGNENYAETNVDDPPNEKPPTKPFVPSTDFDPESPAPFGSALDPPFK